MEPKVTFNKKLIDLVSQYSSIYDPDHPDYKNKVVVDNYWLDIAKNLHSTVEQCQRRWRTLRTAFGKKHKKAILSSSGSDVLRPVSWPYYKQLSFLESYVVHRTTTDIPQQFNENLVNSKHVLSQNDQDCDDSTDTSSSSSSWIYNDSSVQSTCRSKSFTKSAEYFPCCKRRKVKTQQEVQAEMTAFLKKISKQLDNSALISSPLDRFECFGNFVAAQLRSKSPVAADCYMKQISDVLFSDAYFEATVLPSSEQ